MKRTTVVTTDTFTQGLQSKLFFQTHLLSEGITHMQNIDTGAEADLRHLKRRFFL